MPKLDGNTHINLTVTDLERSTRWYCRVFGFVVVNDVEPQGSGFRFRTLVEPASLASVVLGKPASGADERPFDERRVGLHHLAFHVPERPDLLAWREHLRDIGVPCSEITESPHEAGAQIWLRDPDNIWLEVYWTNREFFARRLRELWRAARRSGNPRPFTGTAAAGAQPTSRYSRWKRSSTPSTSTPENPASSA